MDFLFSNSIIRLYNCSNVYVKEEVDAIKRMYNDKNDFIIVNEFGPLGICTNERKIKKSDIKDYGRS